MNIKLLIERLVLDGLSIASGETALVQTAVEAELGRLITSSLFAPTSSFAEAHIVAGEIHLRPLINARELGVQIARRLFASLAADGFRQRTPVKRVPGLSAHDFSRTSNAQSPLRSADVHQQSVSLNRLVGGTQKNVYSSHSTQINRKGK
jgi:hypothetical protein